MTTDSTPKSSEYKTCSKGDKCVHPNGPTLPRTEFYTHSGSRDGYQAICKECHKVNTKKHTSKPKDIAGQPGEKLAIEILNRQGIYASPGKSSEYHWVDVVAWGCIRIEVKTSEQKPIGFVFSMGHKKRKEYERSDFVMLICCWHDGEITYHLLPSNHPVFYHSDGRAKTGVSYMLEPKQRKNRGVILDAGLMVRSRDQWQLIEECRIANGTALKVATEKLTTPIKAINSEKAAVENDKQPMLPGLAA